MKVDILKSCEPLILQHSDATTVLKTIVHWHHQRGGEGHALARVYWHSLICHMVVLLSEIRSNDRVRGMGFDFGDVANALVTCLQASLNMEIGAIEPNICWIAHYGRFSSYDAVGEDAFIQIILDWDGERFHDNRQENRLSEKQVQSLLQEVGIEQLESVYEALAELGWTRHNG